MSNRSRNQRGGKSWLLNGLWFVMIGALIIGFFAIPSDPNIKDIRASVVAKSETLKVWFQTCVPGIAQGSFDNCTLGNGTGSGGTNPGVPGTPAPGTPTPGASTEALNVLAVAPASGANYNRDDWNHWISQGSGCWDTRDKVLYDEAVKDATLILLDKDKKPVTDVAVACSVSQGTWVDPYTGTTITNPKDLDIDHMIPLNYAAQHGGNEWSAERKEQYANDLTNSQHLIAAKASENRSKSDQGPSQWKPQNQAYWCQYATDWVGISTNYGLSVAAEDKQSLTEMLATCG